MRTKRKEQAPVCRREGKFLVLEGGLNLEACRGALAARACVEAPDRAAAARMLGISERELMRLARAHHFQVPPPLLDRASGATLAEYFAQHGYVATFDRGALRFGIKTARRLLDALNTLQVAEEGGHL